MTKASGMHIVWAGCKRAGDERVETYAWFALLNCASFATSAQSGRGKSVCFNTSRIYCRVVVNWTILTVARTRRLSVVLVVLGAVGRKDIVSGKDVSGK